MRLVGSRALQTPKLALVLNLTGNVAILYSHSRPLAKYSGHIATPADLVEISLFLHYSSEEKG